MNKIRKGEKKWGRGESQEHESIEIILTVIFLNPNLPVSSLKRNASIDRKR
jgi:hypothetical protein